MELVTKNINKNKAMDKIEQLVKLKHQLDSGLINDEEFQLLKTEILTNGNLSTNIISDNKKQKKYFPLIVILSILIICLIIGAYLFYNNKTLKNESENSIVGTSSIDSSNLSKEIIPDIIIDTTTIMKQFSNWKANQLANKKYYSYADCDNMNRGISQNYPKTTEYILPDNVDASYGDINHDNKIDGLITFYPEICSGGNAAMNVEKRVLIVSNGNDYTIDDYFMDNIEKKLGDYMHLTSKIEKDVIAVNVSEIVIYGEDPHTKKGCINYSFKKLVYY